MRPAAAEGVQQLGFDFVFESVGLGCLHGTAVRDSGNARGATHRRKLGGILHEPHFVERHAQVTDACRRGDAEAHFFTHCIHPAHHARIPGRIRSRRVVEHRLVGEQFRHLPVQQRDGVGLVKPEPGTRAVRAMAEAVPDFALFVLLAAKQDRAGCVATHEHEHRLGFGEAGQVMEVAVETERVVGIAVADFLGGGRDDRNPLAHHTGEPLPAIGEYTSCCH